MQRNKARGDLLRCVCSFSTMLLCLVGWSPSVLGDWRDDVGYTKLINVLGASAPNGAGVPVSLVEASTEDGHYFPNINNPQFSAASDPLGIQVNFIDGSGGANTGVSGHADSQARTLVSNTDSVAPAANEVTVYEATDYLNRVLNLSGSNNDLPLTQDFRVQNFSWIGGGSDSQDREALRRFDYAIDTNNITAMVGLNNVTTPLPRLLSHSYNALTVGRTDGIHNTGLTTLADYGAGRSKPDLVAPRTSTSAATSSVSSAAIFLHSADTVLGTDAANSATMRAILLAGATKDEFSSWSQIDSGGQWHPLDDTYGAGELNLYNSYLATLGGQFVGDTDTPSAVASHGWDYQTVQPGAGNELLYTFIIPNGKTAAELSIALAWNAKIKSPFHVGAPIVADLNLELVDDAGSTIDLNIGDGIVEGLSASDVDNVEHLYLTDLAAGAYTLKVSSNDLASDFGLAWRTTTFFNAFSADFDQDGDTDGADFLAWQRGSGTLINASRASGDADGDGDVDDSDLAIWQAAFGGGAPAFSSLAVAVPEPTAWVLFYFAVLLAMIFGGRRASQLASK